MTILATLSRDRAYLSVTLTHFFVDMLNNGRSLLVASIAITIGLSNTEVGLALLLYNIGSALAQPLAGILADKYGPRYLVVFGMGWMIAFYIVASLAGDWTSLVALTFAGLGSGAFHPSGAMVASQTKQDIRTRATAYFFTAGQLGLFFGPLLAGTMLDAFDRPGYIVAPLLALVALVASWRWVTNGSRQPITFAQSASGLHASAPEEPAKASRVPTISVVALVLIILAGSTIGISIINFVPKLFLEIGATSSYVGLLSGLFMVGSAFGGIVGGNLGDRFGRRLPIQIGALGSVIPLATYLLVDGPWRPLLLMLAGFMVGMPHSILVLTAQSLLPSRRALASGLTLGLMFFGGSVGSMLVGILADAIDLALVLRYLAVVPLLSLAASFFLSIDRDL